MKSFPVYCLLILMLLARQISGWAIDEEPDDPVSLNNRGVAALNAGQFRDAVKLLNQAAELKPEDTIIQNLAMAMNNLAVQYLSDTEPDKAVLWLRKAMETHPDEMISKNLAQALIMKGRRESDEGRPEMAMQLFRDAVDADTSSSSAREWLGRGLYDQGRLDEALKSIEEAYQLENRDDLRTFSEKIRKEQEGEKNFFERRGLHFRIFYSTDIDQQDVATAGWALERAYQEHRMFLGDAPKGDIPAVFYSSKYKFTSTHDLTSNVAGIYDGKVRLPIPDKPNWETVEKTMSHEVAHAFLFDMGGPDIPLWLNEGLAELLSAGKDRPIPSLTQVLKRGEPVIPVRGLTASLKNLKNNSQASLAYDESYSLAKFIHGRFGVFGIRRFVQSFKEGLTEEEAIRKTLFMTPEMLQQSWEASLK